MHPTILLITPFYPPNIGGVETGLFTLVKLIKGYGLDIIVLTYRKMNNKLFNQLEKYPFLQFFHLVPLLFLKTFCLLFQCWFCEIKGIILHGAGFTGGFIAMITGFIFRIPYVLSTHTIYNRKFNWIERMIIKYASEILCLTNESRKEIGRGIVYYPIIDSDLFKPIDCQYRTGCLFAARPIAKKGWDVIQKLPTEFHVKTCHNVANRLLPLLYNQAQLTITAAQYKECFSRTILESLFCDTPVIASNLDTASEIIPPDVVQFVEPTVDGLTEALKKFKRKPTGFYRNYAKEKFGENNLEIFLNTYIKVFNES